MYKRDTDKEVADTPWVITNSSKAKLKVNDNCNGIQSLVLGRHGKGNIDYCYNAGVYMNGPS